MTLKFGQIFFFKIKENNLPLLLLNARLTKKTFERWKILKSFASEILSSIKVSICSNKETKDYLNYFNLKNIKYFGNIKILFNSAKYSFKKLKLNLT